METKKENEVAANTTAPSTVENVVINAETIAAMEAALKAAKAKFDEAKKEAARKDAEAAAKAKFEVDHQKWVKAVQDGFKQFKVKVISCKSFEDVTNLMTDIKKTLPTEPKLTVGKLSKSKSNSGVKQEVVDFFKSHKTPMKLSDIKAQFPDVNGSYIAGIVFDLKKAGTVGKNEDGLYYGI